MKNIKLVVEYDGSNYVGWQRQKNGLSIQETMEKAIYEATGEKVIVNGSGRTDAKVHARGQVASFKSQSTIPASNFYMALNKYLPDDIKCLSSSEVSDEFHARFSARGKHYQYHILNRQVRPAIKRHYVLHEPATLNLKQMEKALKHFEGEYDFLAFMASKSDVKDTTRRIDEASLIIKDDLIIVDIKGNGFLYNMVRIIVGTIIAVGSGKIKCEDIPAIIASKNRKNAGKTVSPEGLYLMEVYY